MFNRFYFAKRCKINSENFKKNLKLIKDPLKKEKMCLKIDSIEKLPKNLKLFYKYLSKFPSTQYMLANDYSKSKIDFKTSWEIGNDMIRLVLALNIFKARSILKEIIHVINKGNYIVGMTLIRNLIEYSANLYYYCMKISPIIEEIIKKESWVVGKSSEPLDELSKILKNFYFASKLHEDIEKKEYKKAINILTMIDYLEKKEEYSHIKESYNRLCEFVHPNMGTHSIFFRDILRDRNSLTKKNNLYLVYSDGSQNVHFFVEMVAHPLTICYNIFKECIPKLQEKIKLIEKEFKNI